MAFCFFAKFLFTEEQNGEWSKGQFENGRIIIKHYYANGAQKETDIYIQNRQKDALMYGQCSPLCVDCLLHELIVVLHFWATVLLAS